MESRNSKLLNNILKQRRDCVTNETNALEEVVKLLKQREHEVEKESEERAQVRFQI